MANPHQQYLEKVTKDDYYIIAYDANEDNMTFSMRRLFGEFQLSYGNIYFNVDYNPTWFLRDFLRDVLNIKTSKLTTYQIRLLFIERVEGAYTIKGI